MGNTTWSGPIRAGTVRQGASANVGTVVLSQTDTFDHTQVEVNTATGIIIPANSRIVDIIVVNSAAWNSATSDALEIGTTADPDLLADIADIQVVGKATVAVDATQAAVWSTVGTSDITISTTVNETGTSASAGSGRITVLYTQT